MRPGPLESDTCRDFVLPRLATAGWQREQILDQFPITAGRIVTTGRRPRRGDALWADYVLEYRPGLPIAVVEAKREFRAPGNGMQQAKKYAQLLDLPFAYSTNGSAIVEDDRDAGVPRGSSPPSPLQRNSGLATRPGKASSRAQSPPASSCPSTAPCAPPMGG